MYITALFMNKMEECLPSRAATWVSCSMSQFTVLAAIFVATFLQHKIGINSLGNVSRNKQQHFELLKNCPCRSLVKGLKNHIERDSVILLVKTEDHSVFHATRGPHSEE